MLNVELMGDKGFKLEASKNDGKQPTEVIESVVNSSQQGLNEPCVSTHPETGLKVVLFVDDIITRGMREDTINFLMP